MTFAVITSIPDPAKGEAGNLANGPALWIEHQAPELTEDGNYVGEYEKAVEWFLRNSSAITKHFGKSTLLLLSRLCYPVFELGEILLLDEYGREIVGHGRKPSKWFVEYEEFSDVESAVARAREVMKT